MQIDHERSRPALPWFWKGFLKDFVYKVTRSSPDKLTIDFERDSLSFLLPMRVRIWVKTAPTLNHALPTLKNPVSKPLRVRCNPCQSKSNTIWFPAWSLLLLASCSHLEQTPLSLGIGCESSSITCTFSGAPSNDMAMALYRWTRSSPDKFPINFERNSLMFPHVN